MKIRLWLVIFALITSAALFAQQAMKMQDHNMTMAGSDSAQPAETQGLADTTEAMSHHEHMDMGPHMKMTELRPPQPGDQERAQKITEQARQSLEKYKDYRAALDDHYKIFMPNVPSKMKHFTNYAYAMEAAFRFNPDHPTSLLYEKQDDGYKLIGAMYTAPKRYNEDDLNQRVPLSVAQWHEHVNLCVPPQGRRNEMLQPHPQFGLNGAISTKEACGAADGKFMPQIFSWMVHFYPWEKTPDEIWSVERQRQPSQSQGRDMKNMSH